MLVVPNVGAGSVVLDLDQPGVEISLKPQKDVRQAAISPDGRWVATCSHLSYPEHRNVRIWNARTGAHVTDLPLDSATNAFFSPDGRFLVTMMPAGTCKLWDVETWRERRDFGNAWAAFTPDGRLALSDPHGTIRLVEPASGKEVACLTFPEASRYPPTCFSPDGAYLVTTQAELNALYVWDLRLIRGQLKELDLDWDGPEYPAAPRARALRLVVDKGAANAP